MSRRSLVLAITALAVVGFALAGFLYNRPSPNQPRVVAVHGADALVRPHSPILGRADARVTIVEFFDPACETCRAFYPVVKQILAEYPDDVRVVLRYAPFHKDSDEAVKILEAARKQGVFVPVMEALLDAQDEWADHHKPQIAKAWAAAAAAGLNVEVARKAIAAPDITAALALDVVDIRGLGVRKTPTFFVNGQPLLSFGVSQLKDLVRGEVEAARKK